MANSKLARFMRPEMKAETIIDVVIKDKDGNDMPLKVKRLTQKRISELRDIYTTKKPAYDKNGNPLVMNGRIVWSEDRDVESYSRMLLVESLVEPQLDDPELMEFFGIDDVVDMPGAVFTPDEIRQISDITGNLVSFRSLEDVKKEDIEEVKN
jgi:hypothetical protein